MNVSVTRVTPFVLLYALVAALIVFGTSCVMPGDLERLDGAQRRYEDKVQGEFERLRTEQTTPAEFRAELEKARAERQLEVRDIREQIEKRTASVVAAAKDAASDPIGLILTGLGSVAASVLGTNTYRNRTRRQDLERVEESLQETDKWVADVEAKASTGKG